jgi:gliding motility-associated-like protein
LISSRESGRKKRIEKLKTVYTQNTLYRAGIFLIAMLFLCATTNSQNFNWAKSLAGKGTSSLTNLSPGTSICEGIAIDNFNNVYICGFVNDSADFDPGPGTYFLQGGNNDSYFAKYDSSGNLLWAHVIKSNGWNYAKAIKVDKSNNIIVAGHSSSDADFDPGPGIANLTLTPGNANYFFIARYDSAGNYLWAKNAGGKFGVQLFDMAIDDEINIYVTGTMYDTLDLDPGAAINNAESNGAGVFFAKYDSTGNLIWGNCLSGVGQYGGAGSIECSDDNKIYVAGFFGGTIDFDPGPGLDTITPATSADRFFAKYDEYGNLLWANSVNLNNNGGFTVGRCIKTAVGHSDGNLFLAGEYSGTVDFDPGPGQSTLSSPGTYSTFLSAHDSSGNFLWVKDINGGFSMVSDLETDCFDNLYTTGCFSSADFDPGPAIYQLTSTAPSAFMNYFACYDKNGNFTWAKKIGNNGYGGGTIRSVITIKNSRQYVGGAFKQSGDFDPTAGTYILTASGAGHNSFFAKYSSTDTLNFANDTTFCAGQQLILANPFPNANYQWQDSLSNPVFTASQAGEYFVTMTMHNCVFKDSIQIQVKDCSTILQMPNVFSPNSDGVNDNFFPVTAENITQASLIIFNRWGQKLFAGSDLSKGWDGKLNGKNCSDGTYFWIVEYTTIENDHLSMKGFVELIR